MEGASGGSRVPAPDCGAIIERVLVHGAKPFWGPADVPAGGGPAPPGPSGDDGRPGSALGDVSAGRRQRGRAVRLRVHVLKAGADVRVKLVRHGRTLGQAVERNVPAGRLAVKARLNRRGRAALRKSGRLRLTARVTVTAAGAPPATAAARVTLRR